ncbi:MAG: hypothetical protein CMK59_08580 [Proteobacteria bacterium]|nr:hypothetical protein [Pseudomonadota bacterium]
MVNAANSGLRPGSGVCGAIHRGAGVQLKIACQQLNGCETGSAKLTEAFALPAKWVAHAVGPIWYGGEEREAELLSSCYATCLELALEKKASSISFPAISTGIYGFPLEEATEIVFKTLLRFQSSELTVSLVCFDGKTYSLYNKIYQEIWL